MLAWSPDDEKCLDYLDWLRWADSFSCPHCGAAVGYQLGDGRWSWGSRFGARVGESKDDLSGDEDPAHGPVRRSVANDERQAGYLRARPEACA